MKTIKHIFLILLFLVVTAWAIPGTVSAHEVPKERLERLTQGINLSHWMAQTHVTPERIGSYITAADAALIAEMGFKHVRLTLDGEWIMDMENPGTMNPEKLELFDGGLRLMRDAGLAVIVDLHPSDAFKERLDSEEGFVDDVATWWGAMAKHLHATTDPGWVFIEVLNEPKVESEKWFPMQEKFVASIREHAPEHTIIVTGGKWGGLDELLKMEPLDDQNLVYNFHCYDPHTFTHQGASWGYDKWLQISGLPYPSNEEKVKARRRNR